MKPLLNINQIIVLSLFMISTSVSAQKTGTLTEIKIKSSVVCGSCKARIEKNMAYEKGVKSVTVNLTTKEIIITYYTAKTTPALLKIAVSKIGYDADDVPADPKAYEKLPGCCKKDMEVH